MRITISISKEELEALDKARGLISRSAYIRGLIRGPKIYKPPGLTLANIYSTADSDHIRQQQEMEEAKTRIVKRNIEAGRMHFAIYMEDIQEEIEKMRSEKDDKKEGGE